NGREMFADDFDFGQLIDTRERRQIVGDFRVDPIDIFAGRTYPDSVAVSRSNFDTHGFTVHPLFVVKPPDREDIDAYVPLRALLARDLGNVMATGLGLSGHRDAMPVLRMQACTQNHAFAAGTAAALAVKAHTTLRQLDLAPLRRHMVDLGILPAEALDHADNFPASDEAMHDAIANGLDSYRDLAVLMSDPERAGVLLQSSLAAASDDALRCRMAMLLAVMGDDAGSDILLQRLDADAWDEGWNYRGMGQFGMSLSELDRTIVALAMARETRTLPRLLNLARQLDADHAFSHHRATAIACEAFADPDAAPVLAEVLHKPNLRGHAFRDMAVIRRGLPESSTENTPRNNALRELHLARALFRCGDHDGLGEAVLREYAQDFRGCFARHARAVLSGAPGREAEPLCEPRGEAAPLGA
ncbi:MAG: FAD-dependent oxidoreductase, partial [Phycisphaeraceae bacterium]